MTKIDLESGKFDSEERIMLGLLTAVHDNEELSQRSLASELSIALGLANTYLKRCIKKGLIKVKQAPANRYAYYLTPQGFSEKTRLTAEFLSQSFTLFRVARTEAADIYGRCLGHGWRRIVLIGGGDLAEIIAMSVPDGVEALALFDPKGEGGIEGIETLADETALAGFDAAIVCTLRAPFEARDLALRHLPRDRILAPGFLRIDRNESRIDEEDDA